MARDLNGKSITKDMVALILGWETIIGGREGLVFPEAAVAQWEIY